MSATSNTLRQRYLPILLDENGTKDVSEEGKLRRRKMMLRAIYGEFIGTNLFYIPIFGVIANSYTQNWSPEFTLLSSAFVASFSAVALTMCFSSISGANFNCDISYSLWLTGKLSNRKVIFYIIAQISATFIIYCTFTDTTKQTFEALSVSPANGIDLGR